MYASVADELEFDSWPKETRDLARRVILGGFVYAYQVNDEKPKTIVDKMIELLDHP